MEFICVLCKKPLCNDCACCHTEGCLLNGKSVTDKSAISGMAHLTARTQKAKGYAVLSTQLNVPKPFAIISEEADIQSMSLPSEAFARPCPVRPRHGFVESRPAKREELASILQEAKAADPEAELLVVPLIKATHNVILTPARMAIGPGNDGATAGKRSVVFPLAGVPFLELNADIIAKAGVKSDEDPYIESVIIQPNLKHAYTGHAHPNGGVYFTQLRAGAKIPASVGRDFVPEEVTVQRVIEASGDLLEWERQVKEDIKPGCVVYHLGGTLVSHYGVHCIFHNVPIFTTRVPEVGEVIKPTPKLERPVPEAVIQGLGMAAHDKTIGMFLGDEKLTGFDVPLNVNHTVTLLLVAAHNAVAMTGDDGKWLGIAAVLMMRLGMAASHGEARHKRTESDWGSLHTRALIYKMALNNFFEARANLGCAQWRFQNLEWSRSYGGPKWAACTDSILRLDRAAQALIRTPGDEQVTELIDALHNAINQAHNGGWWLNKFVKQFVFDMTCKQSMYPLCAAAPFILDIAQLRLGQAAIMSTIERWAKEPEPVIHRGYEPVKPVYDPANQPQLVESEVPADALPFDTKCGYEACSTCYPEKAAEIMAMKEAAQKQAAAALKVKQEEAKYSLVKEEDIPAQTAPGNVNASAKIPPTAEVEVAQAVASSTKIHVQYKVKGINGYFSFNTAINKPIKPVPKELSSYSGSGNLYFPLKVEKDPTSHAWRFFNSDANVDFVHALKEGAK